MEIFRNLLANMAANLVPDKFLKNAPGARIFESIFSFTGADPEQITRFFQKARNTRVVLRVMHSWTRKIFITEITNSYNPSISSHPLWYTLDGNVEVFGFHLVPRSYRASGSFRSLLFGAHLVLENVYPEGVLSTWRRSQSLVGSDQYCKLGLEAVPSLSTIP